MYKQLVENDALTLRAGDDAVDDGAALPLTVVVDVLEGLRKLATPPHDDDVSTSSLDELHRSLSDVIVTSSPRQGARDDDK